jgi:putative transcriptional regulator
MTGYLTDTLLISNPAISDVPKFSAIANSAIYIIHHNAEGAVGIGVNTSYSATVTEAGKDLPNFLLVDKDTLLTEKLICGGPIGGNMPWILGNNFEQYDQQVKNASLALNFSSNAFEQNSENHFSVCGLGTFGWGPGQLENEMQNFIWHMFPTTEEVLNMFAPEHQYRGGAQLLLALKYGQ